LRIMSGARWRSALVAALFAIHPLHVESVAWVAERKDVLSASFWMLTLVAYARYAARRSFLRYTVVVAALSLGLLAKPMLVSLPCVLLLLDYWPLHRVHAGPDAPQPPSWGRLVLEKLPLFGLVGVSSVVTLYAQKHGGAMPSLHELPLAFRIGNALISYVVYIEKMFLPVNLSVYYPHASTHLPWLKAVGAAAFLLTISGLAVWSAPRRPYALVGWLWYLGTLFPVIGVVQVGGQAFADRYTYVPLIGLFMILAWGAAEIAALGPKRRLFVTAASVAALITLTAMARREVTYWRDSVTLFTRANEVTTDNVAAHDGLGLAALAQRNFAVANYHFQESLRITPRRPEANNYYGVALAEQERYDEAIVFFRRVLELDPTNANAHNNWGNALYRQGHIDEAITHYAEALRLDPEYADAMNSMGAALITQGKPVEAVAYLTKAVAFAPKEAQYRLNLAVALDIRGNPADADEVIALAREALRLDPHFTKAVDFLRALHAEP